MVMSFVPSMISAFTHFQIPPVQSLPPSFLLTSNPASMSRLSICLSNRPSSRRPRRVCARNSVSGGSHGDDYAHERVICRRPTEVPWKKELANSIHLIGIIGAPVQIKHLSSGKVLAWTRPGVKKSPSETTWINLTLWDELAHVAFQHVEKGQQVHVSGRLVSDTVEGGDQEKPQVYYKVVVQQLDFIERTIPSVSLYNSDANSMTTTSKIGTSPGGSVEVLWQAFFSNPHEWWDNRKNKKTPKYPDFKHKDTGESLWIEGKYNPPWVKSQLVIYDSRVGLGNASDSNSIASVMYNDG